MTEEITGGVLLIDKPIGPTSHDVVAAVRRTLKTRRVGHGGTLDPAASGLLMVCVGEATRVLEYLTNQDKSYTGDIVFGVQTDTDDATGAVIARTSARTLTNDEVQRALPTLTGRIQQVVPAYSAVHIDGVRAYELARRGQQVDMPTRDITISSFTVESLCVEGDVARARFHVTCSKGTYIRALCRDLGALLEMPAHMGSLRRVGIGHASIKDAVELEVWKQSEEPWSFVQPALSALTDQVIVDLDAAVVERLSQGQRVVGLTDEPLQSIAVGQTAFVRCQGQLALVAERIPGREVSLKPKKVFWKRG